MSERIYQVIIGVLVLIVLVGGWMMIASKRNKPETTMGPVAGSEDTASDENESTADDSSVASPTKEATVSSKGSAVSVADQAAGKSVAVKSVTLKNRGWVAIEDQKEWILGAQRLEAGTHEDVTVSLLRATLKGQTYKAVLFVDDGDGKFDLHKDTRITNEDGSVLSAAFITK